MEERQSNTTRKGFGKDVDCCTSACCNVVATSKYSREVDLFLKSFIKSLVIKIVFSARPCSHAATLKKVEGLSNTQATVSKTHSDVLVGTKSTVDHIRGTVQGLEATSRASNHCTSQAFEELGDRMRDLECMSIGQSETLEAILEFLKQQVSVKPPRFSAENMSHKVVDIIDNVEMEQEEQEFRADDSLQDTLDRLCLLAEEKEKTVFFMEADAIIHDVEQLIALTRTAKSGVRFVKDRKGKRRRESCDRDSDSDDWDPQYQRQVKRIKGLLAASRCLGINEKGLHKVPYAHRFPTLLICDLYPVPRPWKVSSQQNYKFENIHRRHSHSEGTMSIKMRRIYDAVFTSKHSASTTSEDSILEMLEASFIFMPIPPQTTRIEVTFQQRMSYQGSFLRKPIVSFSALLPDDSKVFQLAENGDLEGLMSLLTRRKASLTDRDSKGRCLLNVSNNRTT